MYYPVYVISPFSQAKKKLSDSAKRLAITELILLIFNSIFYGIIISLLFEMVNDYSYFLLFDLIFAAFMLMIWIVTLWGAQMFVIVVNYVFFFMLSSAFTSLGNSEIRIENSAKKTGTYMLAGIITSVIATIVSIFNLLTNFITTIIATALLTYAFYHEVETFKDLEKNNLYRGEKSRALLYSQALRCFTYILLPIALYQPIRVAVFMLILFLLLLIASSLFFVIGLFKLSNEANRITDPSPPQVHPSQVPTYSPNYPTHQPQTPSQQIYIQYPEQEPKPLQNQPTQHSPQKETDTMFCSNCGRKVKKTAKFCEECGYNLIE